MKRNLRLLNAEDPNYIVEVNYNESISFTVRYVNDRNMGEFYFNIEDEFVSTLPDTEIQRLRHLIRGFVNQYIEQL
ncbi:hypothetical protein OCI51_20355 [Lysinibacillus capsici]|uniref:hypothetical protein n=1 Tax=Lysinibacillus capsici TaxID=2115968 RepID=UPI0021DB6784|nr:hypothetical protein [Lysinibacillus capsici]UYB46523.1 hypothetical protein OCI51_20355 [Lysinibacillus capsici]